MSCKSEALAFISYRRADSCAASRWLARTIARTFGPRCVFIDTEATRIGDAWPARIEQALTSASVLIPVIGPGWLSITDEHGRRRLDKEDDWICNEIRYALQAKIPVIPLLLSNTAMPEKRALPEVIASLASVQGHELRDSRWESDLSILLDRLAELGLGRLPVQPVRHPAPRIALTELTEVELASELATLADWKIVISQAPGREPVERTELYRSLEFASFEDAIAFMAAAARTMSEMDHHPRWENVWRTVSIWLSTWDIGHKPSALDVRLARSLEQLRSAFPPAKAKRK